MKSLRQGYGGKTPIVPPIAKRSKEKQSGSEALPDGEFAPGRNRTLLRAPRGFGLCAQAQPESAQSRYRLRGYGVSGLCGLQGYGATGLRGYRVTGLRGYGATGSQSVGALAHRTRLNRRPQAACSETAFPMVAFGAAAPNPAKGRRPLTPPGTSVRETRIVAPFGRSLRFPTFRPPSSATGGGGLQSPGPCFASRGFKPLNAKRAAAPGGSP